MRRLTSTILAAAAALWAGDAFAQQQNSVPQCQYPDTAVQGGAPSTCGNILGFIGSDGKFHRVTASDPLPTASSGGGGTTAAQGAPNAGGAQSWWERLTDNLGNAITSTLNGGKQSLDVNQTGATPAGTNLIGTVVAENNVEAATAAQTITVEASSHANNTCLGALQVITVTQGVVSGGFTLNVLTVRSSSGLTGQFSAFVFYGSAPTGACVNDGAAWALSAADQDRLVPGGSQSTSGAAYPGGVTQSSYVFQFLQGLQLRLDANKRFWVAVVNTNGAAQTPAANGLTLATNGYASTY